MYCINCRYYDRYIKVCLNRDGIKRQLKDCEFCSYCEPKADVEMLCKNCVFYQSEMNGTGFCNNPQGLKQCVFNTDYCSSFCLFGEPQTTKNEEPKVGWLYKNEDKGYIILEKINERGLCEVYNYDENGEKLTYTLGVNSLGEPIMQAFKVMKE